MLKVLIGIVVFVAATAFAAKVFFLDARVKSLSTSPLPRETPTSNSPVQPIGTLTKLPIELIGTIVRVEGRSIATIKFANQERENVFEKSSIHDEATVTRIERERVYFTLKSTGLAEYVRLKPYDPALAFSAKLFNVPGDSKEFNLSRLKIDQQLQNLPQLLTTARAVPVIESGRVVGFRIESMDETSFFRDLGLQPGDVLTEVNGTKLDSGESALKLYNELRESSMINLRASRQSRELQLRYLIR